MVSMLASEQHVRAEADNIRQVIEWGRKNIV
jgi:hypothetical protein